MSTCFTDGRCWVHSPCFLHLLQIIFNRCRQLLTQYLRDAWIFCFLIWYPTIRSFEKDMNNSQHKIYCTSSGNIYIYAIRSLFQDAVSIFYIEDILLIVESRLKTVTGCLFDRHISLINQRCEHIFCSYVFLFNISWSYWRGHLKWHVDRALLLMDEKRLHE